MTSTFEPLNRPQPTLGSVGEKAATHADTGSQALSGWFSNVSSKAIILGLLRLMTVLLLLYTFLVGVKTLEGAVKLIGAGAADGLLNITSNPFSSLMAGMLVTVLLQSSSVTTAIIVGLVSAGTISLGGAVPMIMGANLGTSVTNTLVSLGHLKNRHHFKRAFAAATIHDFFNILSVIVLLPLEIAFGLLQKMSTALAGFLYGNVEGIKYTSPIKTAIKPAVETVKAFTADVSATLFSSSTALTFVMTFFAGLLIILSLSLIIKVMRPFVESHRSELINSFIANNAATTIIFGILITMSVQSSSITTSLLVPMAGSGLLSLSSIFPITVGANIGTTATALLAALTANVAGLAIALVHFFFNVFATCIWFIPSKTRKIPLWFANNLAIAVDRSKWFAVLYISIVFFAMPISLIYLFG